MAEADDQDPLSLKTADYVAAAAKSALGAVPFAGSLLAEVAGSVIPNQRIDRIVRFARELDQRLAGIQRVFIRARLTDENFTDLLEEGLRQAARSTTDERRRHIASIIGKSLASDDVPFIEAKHLLRILGEINDIEVIWLRFYLHPEMQTDHEFRKLHESILSPVAASMQSTQAEIDDETLQNSYKEHLERVGLLSRRYQVNTKSKQPEFDPRTGVPKTRGHELTRLGRLLLRHLGFDDPLAQE
jgi:hypothetical protein